MEAQLKKKERKKNFDPEGIQLGNTSRRSYQVVPVICLELEDLLHPGAHTHTHTLQSDMVAMVSGWGTGRDEGKWCCWKRHVNSVERSPCPLGWTPGRTSAFNQASDNSSEQ